MSSTESFAPYIPSPPKPRGRPKVPIEPIPVTFERPPYANEVWTQDGKQKFDRLQGWQRHFVKRIVEHGNWQMAARESNVENYVPNFPKGAQSKVTITAALENIGIDANFLAAHLRECIEAKVIRLDKNGNPIPDCVDLRLKLKAIEFTCRLLGYMDPNDETGRPNDNLIDLFRADD